MSKEVFQNSEGSTGTVKIENGAPVFVPFASQEEADASLKPAQKAQPDVSLPANFPERDLLIGTAFKTLDTVKAATDEELLAVDGIGPAKLKAIRDALRG